MNKKLIWYWKRLRRMSVSEILYRFKKTIYMQFQKIGIFTAKTPPRAKVSGDNTCFIFTSTCVDHKLYITRGDKLVQGYVDLLALSDLKIGNPPNWNKDPRTGKESPLVFGKTLDYRSTDIVGDVRYVWELNRHLHLVTLAQAYNLTKDRKYLDTLHVQILSWINQCEYLLGPNWISSLEFSLRLINWSIIWQLIGGENSDLFKSEEGKSFRDLWLRSIYQHTHFIHHHYSYYSSANNHLIGEASGVFVSVMTWPYWTDFSNWKNKAYDLLVKECINQNEADGVNKEQAIWYQQFVLDFLLISALSGKARNIDFPKAYWDRIESMLEFISSIMDVNGNIPMIGDSDDGRVVKLCDDIEGFNPFKSLLATGAVLFNRAEFKKKAGSLDDKTKWLLGDEAVNRYEAIRDEMVTLPVKTAFSDSGYFVLGNEYETEKEVRIVADAAPLGYLSIAAHGHADALSFVLSISGVDILIDPGTYVYHSNQMWRNYFRSTAAHNTVRIDKLDQSIIGGNFMWTEHANAKCMYWQSGEEIDQLIASHDGYKRLNDPVIHQREITLLKKEHTVNIVDEILCNCDHEIERFWHFAEHCEVVVKESELKITTHEIEVSLNAGENSIINVYRGNMSPISGWISRVHDAKVPTSTVVFTNKIKGNTKLVTKITWKFPRV